MGKKKSHNVTTSTAVMPNPTYDPNSTIMHYDPYTGNVTTGTLPRPSTSTGTSPYYTTTITSTPPNPAWLDKDFHEYVAMKDQFKKYKELLKEFQKYLAHKDAFEEYLEEYNSKIDVPTTLDI